MSIEVSAKNMAAIAAARKQHDANCPGPATTVVMHPVEIERCGWEEGDVIAGLRLQSDPTMGTGTFRVVCGLTDPTLEDVDAYARDEDEVKV